MLDRFSEEARSAVDLAEEEARGLGHSQVGTEHLLLALVGQRGTPASKALTATGVFPASCREKVVEALANRPGSRRAPDQEDTPMTARGKRVLDRAGKVSLRLGTEMIGSEHVLLALLDVEGTACQVLRGLSVDPQSVRQALEHHDQPVVEPSPEAAPEAGPVCGTCRSPLDQSLDHVEMTAGSSDHGLRVEVVYCNVCGSAVGVLPKRR